MPICSRCGRVYSPHARNCPTCFDDRGQPRMIQSAFPVPIIGDTWTDPDAGDTQFIVGVHVTGTAILLNLADGTIAEVDIEHLKPAAAGPESQPGTSLELSVQVSP